MSRKKRKVRAEFRKNREVRTRDRDLTDAYRAAPDSIDDTQRSERISGKGALSRKRTVAGGEVVEDDAGTKVLPDIDKSECMLGRVISVQGLNSQVRSEDGQLYRCATRRLLKTLSTDQRHIVATGDRVWIRPSGTDEGVIERVEPRYGVLSRTSRGRQHVIVANVDQLVIVTSVAEPTVKPNLIDRFLITAERAEIKPLICFNKIDLIEPGDLQALIGGYAQLGYDTVQVSASTGAGVEQLKEKLAGKASVFTGQSGVGKSSLLNVIHPELHLRVRTVSGQSQKGRHTTTNATLIPFADNAYVIDTPGIRQLELWDVIPEEVAGYFREFRPYVSQCRFPDCTHLHEIGCAVRDAVEKHQIDGRRYYSYGQIFHGERV